jgi:hypothetical protein
MTGAAYRVPAISCHSPGWTAKPHPFPIADEETVALLGELDRIIDGDRYPFSPRIRMLKEIRDKLRPPPVREPLPPLRHYEPPRAKASRRRG